MLKGEKKMREKKTKVDFEKEMKCYGLANILHTPYFNYFLTLCLSGTVV
jgi:hypothetical protein